VVNQRLKGNAMYWRESGAESMLQQRALVVSQRWDEALASKQALRRHTRLTTWHWQSQPAGPPEAGKSPKESPTKHAQS
jgi:hypothetical protein